MREVLRAQTVAGRIPRPDRLGGEVIIFAVFHAFYSNDGSVEFLGYWGADDGCDYQLPEELNRFEHVSDAESAKARAEAVWRDWLFQIVLEVHDLNSRLALGEGQLPGDEGCLDRGERHGGAPGESSAPASVAGSPTSTVVSTRVA